MEFRLQGLKEGLEGSELSHFSGGVAACWFWVGGKLQTKDLAPRIPYPTKANDSITSEMLSSDSVSARGVAIPILILEGRAEGISLTLWQVLNQYHDSGYTDV